MKAWKKGAIIGAVWGIISSLPFFIRIQILSEIEPNLIIIFTFPMSLAVFFLLIIDILGFPFYYLSVFFIEFASILLSILFGAIIGSIVGISMQKYKERRESNASSN